MVSKRERHTRRKPHDGPVATTVHELHAEHELRVEVCRAHVRAAAALGLAEARDGAQPRVVYNFEGPRQFAVFTWSRTAKGAERPRPTLPT